MYRVSMTFTRETEHLRTAQYDSAESAGAAIADALHWPGFCFGAWRQGSVCCVFGSEAQREAHEDGAGGDVPCIVTVAGAVEAA